MHGTSLQNRCSLTLKSTPQTYAPWYAVTPSPLSPAAALANVDLDDVEHVGGPAERASSRMWTTRSNIPPWDKTRPQCIPFFWSCLFVLGILLCVITKDVQGFPTRDNAIEKSLGRSKRSASDHNYDHLALNWFLNRGNDRASLLPNLRSREARNIPDQILAEMEAEWYENYGPDSATGSASGRSRRFAHSPPEDDEEDERIDQRRSRRFAHPHEEDGKMDRRKSFTDPRPRFARSLTNQRLADLLFRHRLRHRMRQTKSPFPGQGSAAASDQA